MPRRPNINPEERQRRIKEQEARTYEQGRRTKFLDRMQADKADRTAGQQPRRPMNAEQMQRIHNSARRKQMLGDRSRMDQMKKFAPADGFGWNNMRSMGRQMPQMPGQMPGQIPGQPGLMPGQMPGYGQMYPPPPGYGQMQPGLAQMLGMGGMGNMQGYGQQMGMGQPGMGNPQQMQAQQMQAQLQGQYGQQRGQQAGQPIQAGDTTFHPGASVGGGWSEIPTRIAQASPAMEAWWQKQFGQAQLQGRVTNPQAEAAAQMDWGPAWEGPGGKEDWLKNYRMQRGLPR